MSRRPEVRCETCGAIHEATPSHQGHWGEGQVFEVVCTEDGKSDFYTVGGLVDPGAWKP